MNCHYCAPQRDYGGSPYVANTEQLAMNNTNFRTAIWTGDYFQMTLMHIPPCGEIGLEMHPDTDQLIRIEQGNAIVKMGKGKKISWISNSTQTRAMQFLYLPEHGTISSMQVTVR